MTQMEQLSKDSIKVTCECKSHEGHGNAAIITGPCVTALAGRKGKAQSDRIHGFVLLANHPAPMMRMAAKRDGVVAA